MSRITEFLIKLLVSAPETVMDGIFTFLGVSPVPDIVARCFSSEQERLGMADYKVWHTNRVSSDSVGRGWNIPSALIPEPILDGVNELAGRLGYMQIDPASWGMGSVPHDMRSTDSGRPAALVTAGTSREVNDVAALLGERARDALRRIDGVTRPRWLAAGTDTVVMAVLDLQKHGGCAQVLVNVGARSVQTLESAQLAPARTPGGCLLAGPAAIWREVLAREINLGVAMRLNQIRFSGSVGDWQMGELMTTMISDLLGLTSWPVSIGEPGRIAVPAGLA